MPKTKDFDAVELKRAIQQRIADEYAGLTPDETRAAQRRRIEEDPELGPFLRKVRTLPARPTVTNSERR